VRFTKAHGLGNDFILVEAGDAPLDPGSWARRLCDRHEGIGGDGVLLYEQAPDGVRMRLINADGGEAEISGNGVRCLAAFALRQGWAEPGHLVHTAAGARAVEVVPLLGRTRFRVSTDLGAPRLGSEEIPVALDPPRAAVIAHPLEVGGRTVKVTAVSFGNPHCAVIGEEPVDDATIAVLGPALEAHPFFPRRTNVEFVSVTRRDEVRARFWERGVGSTRASGTGAASAAVAAMLLGRADRRVRVRCDGGALDVEWPEGGSVIQVGEVEIVFEGDWLA
jgi:diaminopimelate epimerase